MTVLTNPIQPPPMVTVPGQPTTYVINSSEKTLRDEFAMAAMGAIMSHSGGRWIEDALHEYALTAYAMADAMLEARKVGSA